MDSANVILHRNSASDSSLWTVCEGIPSFFCIRENTIRVASWIFPVPNNMNPPVHCELVGKRKWECDQQADRCNYSDHLKEWFISDELWSSKMTLALNAPWMLELAMIKHNDRASHCLSQRAEDIWKSRDHISYTKITEGWPTSQKLWMIFVFHLWKNSQSSCNNYGEIETQKWRGFIAIDKRLKLNFEWNCIGCDDILIEITFILSTVWSSSLLLYRCHLHDGARNDWEHELIVINLMCCDWCVLTTCKRWKHWVRWAHNSYCEQYLL